MRSIRRYACLVAVAAAIPIISNAQQEPEVDAEAEIARLCTPKPPFYRIPPACASSRLGSYEPIYAVFQRTEDDESSLRFHYSLRYTLFMRDCLADYGAALVEEAPAKHFDPARRAEIARSAVSCIRGFEQRHEFYLMYTGEFDFYPNTRPSGPVVNRISNPGAHYRRYIDPHGEGGVRIRWIDVGIEHRSDGQTTDPHERINDPTSPDHGRYRAQVEYEKGNHAYLDSISQDTNYVVLGTMFQTGERTELWVLLKPFYLSDDTAITWGPMAEKNVHMRDYDRLRFIVAQRIGGEKAKRNDERRFYVEWTIGDKALATDSFNFNLYWPVRWFGATVPLYARLHRGPLNTLSDFAKEQTSFGLGLLLLQ